MRNVKIKTIALWILQIILALMLFGAGLDKFTNEVWVGQFEEWGYPDNFVYVIGAFEMLGALGLLIPRLIGYAAAGLCVIFIGATITQWIADASLGFILFHLVFVLVLGGLAYVRRPAWLGKAPSPSGK